MSELPTAAVAPNLSNLGGAAVGDYVQILKPRVMSLVVFTGVVGLVLAPGRLHPFLAAVAVLCIVTWIGFGEAAWAAFVNSFEFTRVVILEQGDTGFYKMQSPFAAVRLWGGPVWLAYFVQGAAVLAIVYFLVRLWRSKAAFELKAAALLAGTLISTPYLLDYDLMVMAPAIALGESIFTVTPVTPFST